MAKGKKGGKSAPHQMPPHPAVNNPANHPAAGVPPATNDHDGDEMPPGLMAMMGGGGQPY